VNQHYALSIGKGSSKSIIDPLGHITPIQLQSMAQTPKKCQQMLVCAQLFWFEETEGRFKPNTQNKSQMNSQQEARRIALFL
jgi:hypothetical protein